jgi:hypothetical protein
MRTWTSTLSSLVIAAVCTADTIQVPGDQPTIQAAIDAAAGGDIVVVASGTYAENIDFLGKAITVISASGAATTIIDGNQKGSTVLFAGGEGPDSVLDGFTLRNGIGTELAPLYEYGGGILCKNVSSPLIRNNIIIENYASFGGGIYCSSDSFPEAANNIIFDNVADWAGGGILCIEASMMIENCTIHGNSASLGGGGIYCIGNSTIDAVNSIFWENAAPKGPDIAVRSAAAPSMFTISFSNVKNGPAAVHVDPGCTLDWGPGMIDSDPLFVDAGNGDFHLTFQSPCRASGDNSAPGLPFVDFEGDPRIAHGTVDMGADEFYTHLYCTGEFTPGGSIAGKLAGLPGTTPVGLFLGAGVLDPPHATAWGNFHLQAPWLMIPLVPIPSNGVLVLPATIPATPPAPYNLFTQALIGLQPDSLTNVLVLEVR